MENEKILFEFAKIVEEMKDNIFTQRGLKKEGKGNYGKIFSEGQLIDLLREYKDRITFTWVPVQSLAQATPTGYLTIAEAMVVVRLVQSDQSLVLNAKGPGSDKNDASFAGGKAQTYTKRYFFTKLLDLGADDLEPDNAENIHKEHLTFIIGKFKELTEENKTKYTARLAKEFKTVDVGNLKGEQLSTASQWITTLVAKQAKELSNE